jgi:3-deoxy-7-phosphoheptulonate synthase
MVIVTSPDVTGTQLDAVLARIRLAGGEAVVSRGAGRVLIGLRADTALSARLDLAGLPGVAGMSRPPAQYELVSREPGGPRSVVDVAGTAVGAGTTTVIAGPCAVESPEQTLASAELAVRAGATLLRGGAFKPRSSPYAFQGLGERGLRILAEVRAETGLPVVTEVIDAGDVDLVSGYADMVQIGTRNMQNFALLRAVGASGKPVLLKRGMNATIEEWLLAAEYVAQCGNLDIVLCERGIRTFERATRNTLDISAVPVVQSLSHLPVIVDPSHSGGHRELVLPLSKAALAVGADGVIVDVHPDPATALCDGPQALTGPDVDELAEAVRALAGFTGRSLNRRRAMPRAA